MIQRSQRVTGYDKSEGFDIRGFEGAVPSLPMKKTAELNLVILVVFLVVQGSERAP